MSLYAYHGKLGTTWGYRFWYKKVLYEKMVGHNRALAEEAEKRERARLEVAAWEGRYGPLAPRLTRWPEVVERYAAAKAQKRSLQYDRYILAWWTTFFAERKIHYLQEVSPELLDAAKLSMLRAGKGPGTLQRHLSVLRALCNLAVKRWRILRENPVLSIDWPRARTKTFPVPTPEELRRLLKAADPLLRPIILTAIFTGLRAGDILRLTAENFQERPGWVKGYGGKADLAVWIPVVPELQETIDGLGITSGKLFRRPDGESYTTFPRERWNATRVAAGLPALRFHDIRHGTGTLLAEAGIPQRVIQSFLGHSSGHVTERYTRPHEAGLREAAIELARRMEPPKEKTTEAS